MLRGMEPRVELLWWDGCPSTERALADLRSALREVGVAHKTSDQVLRLARLGVANGIDGLVASPQEARMLRQEFGDRIKIVTPGIRPPGSDSGDQKRFTTPREAIENGADYLVIGRPITAAPDPRAAVERIVEELAN